MSQSDYCRKQGRRIGIAGRSINNVKIIVEYAEASRYTSSSSSSPQHSVITEVTETSSSSCSSVQRNNMHQTMPTHGNNLKMRNFMLVAATILLACGSGPSAHAFTTTPTKSCCHPPFIYPSTVSTAARRASPTEVQQLLMESFTTALRMSSSSSKEQEDETILQMQRRENEEGERIRRESRFRVRRRIRSAFRSLRMSDTEESVQTEDITWSRALDPDGGERRGVRSRVRSVLARAKSRTGIENTSTKATRKLKTEQTALDVVAEAASI
eukprot:796299-Ditylum_brightwellii.AAC.1